MATKMIKSSTPGADPDKPNMVKQWTFTWRGVDVKVSEDDLDDVEIQELFEDDKVMAGYRRMLGQETWSNIKQAAAAEDGRVPSSAIQEFFETFQREVGPTQKS